MNEFQQRVAEQERVLSVLESPRHLVEIGLQVLCRNPMPRSDDATLQKREGRLNRIRVEVAIYILFRTVIHDMMLLRGHRGFSHRGRVGHEIIGHDYVNVSRDVVADVLRQRSALGIFSMKESKFSPALADSDYNFLRLLAVVHTLADFLSTHIGLVNLACAFQFWFVQLLHGMTDAMAEIPCRPVVDLEHPMQLVSTHTLLRLADQVGCKEPFGERQMCIVKDRASGHGELIAARLVITVVLIALQDRRNFGPKTLRTSDTVGPAEMFEVIAAVLVIAVTVHQFAKINSFFHRSTRA